MITRTNECRARQNRKPNERIEMLMPRCLCAHVDAVHTKRSDDLKHGRVTITPISLELVSPARARSSTAGNHAQRPKFAASMRLRMRQVKRD